MAKRTLSLLSLVILSLSCTALANNFLETSCKVTRYPTECVQSLTPQVTAIGQSPVKLAEIALSTSLTKSQALHTFLVRQTKKRRLGPKELTALKDCLDGLDDTLDQLAQSVMEMSTMTKASTDQFMMHKSNVQTWVSSVMTDFNTCVEGFGETSANPKFTDAVKAKVVEAEHDTSNALALINQLQGPA
ncbi:hypothetical protein LguiB_004370 [Lonicera macranthoides]